MMKISSLIAVALFFTHSAVADVTFTTTSTGAEVNSIAGSANNLGVQQPPNSIGLITNNAFAQVQQNSEGDGRGQGAAEVRVNISEVPVALFGGMQTTASILPADGEAFSDASLTFFVNKRAKLFVEELIDQGNTTLLIDSEVQTKKEGTFDLLPGQHTLEIRSQTTFSTVTNPNYQIAFDIQEVEGDDPPGGGSEPPVGDDGNDNRVQIVSVIRSQLDGVRAPTEKTKKTYLSNLKSIKFSLIALRSELESLGALSNKKTANAMKQSLRIVKSLRSLSDRGAVNRAKRALSRKLNEF